MKNAVFILSLFMVSACSLSFGQVEKQASDSNSVSNTSMITDSLHIISTTDLDSAAASKKSIAKDGSLVAKAAAPVDSIAIRNTFVKDSLARAKVARKKLYSRPRRATIMSAILPGLGQAYNKKYWKLPIIYGGLGVFAYIFITNNKQYNYYRKNLRAAYDSDSSTVNTSGYSGDQLETLKVQYRKTRDVGMIGMCLIYIFNIIDANVDGHLKTFDVSDELSLHIEPWQNINRSGPFGFRTATGLSLKLNFK